MKRVGYRHHFIRYFDWLAFFLPLHTLIEWSGVKLVFPLYHSIEDQAPDHLRHLYKVRSTEQFREDLDYFTAHFEHAHPELLVDVLRGLYIPKKPLIVLTFDDGLRSFYEVAAPMLAERGMSAISFINSAFVDNKALFYRYKASILIEDYLDDSQKWKDRKLMKRFELKSHRVAESLLAIDYANRLRLDEIASEVDVHFSDYLKEVRPYMTSKEIKELADNGFYFGGHSIDHPYFAHISAAEQLNQLRTSIDYVQTLTGCANRMFAFPFTHFGCSEDLFAAPGDGTLSDVYFGTAALTHDPDRRLYQRIPMEASGESARKQIKSSFLYEVLKDSIKKFML